MLPYKSLIKMDKDSAVPLYLQLSNELIKHISAGVISGGTKLPGSRLMSSYFGINRRTVSTAYEELEAQGWIQIVPNKGAYVISSETIQESRFKGIVNRVPFEKSSYPLSIAAQARLEGNHHLDVSLKYRLDDGHPDVRLAPMKELYRHMRAIQSSPTKYKLMGYTQQYSGDKLLKEELAKYLIESRSLQVSEDQIMITRGSLMAFYLLFKTLLNPGEKVVVADIGFVEAYETIQIAGGTLHYVPIDNYGIDVDEIERLLDCEVKIKCIYIVPHHQYPTTVTLSAERRRKLLWLSTKYRFAIIEDDYDYDFHYSSSPILPLASSDTNGSVVYVGSLSKTLAPSLRIGYIIAPTEVIKGVTSLSTYIDSHGNTALERGVAMLFKEGEVNRHLKKALRTYRIRRDHFCTLLKDHLADYISFEQPEGGLTIWAKLNNGVTIEELAAQAARHDLYINDGSNYNTSAARLDAIRIGFASLEEDEALRLVVLLKKVFESLTD